ncbi:MAG: gamma-glutamyltransferase [Rhodospirillales bacterium]|nr:gamma-glutamyltransferase [Rhodospirillales bacterium]
MRAHRPLLMGRHGAVGANHPMAAQAGLDMLRAGGNAADAAAAIALALGVVEPMMSGLGGDGFYHAWIGGKAEVFNGTGPAAAAAVPEAFPAGIEIEGPRSVSVPGMLGGIGALHAAHGRLPWAKLCEPATGLARGGYGLTVHGRGFAADNVRKLAADPRSAATFLADGHAPPLGSLIVQENLARTLEIIAAEGAESFYRGRLAKALAAGCAERGVAITEADLAAFHAQIQEPIAITYRGFEIRQTPPNSTGFTMLQILKIAERFDLAAMNEAQRIHVLVEAKKLAFLDRERFGADPRSGSVPIERLLSDAHADALAARISLDRAADVAQTAKAADTTYFCVVDAEGNAISGIQSLNSLFGSGVTAGETGVLLNNRMAYWHLAEGHANRLAPGKRVRHTMNAPMIFRHGKLWAVLGTPGADNQVQVNAQVVASLIDLGLDPQQALERPRWTSSQADQGANWPHEGDGRLTIERDVGDDTLAALAGRGHKLAPVGHLEGPCAMQVIRVLDNGIRMAASDPRRDGWAGAY